MTFKVIISILIFDRFENMLPCQRDLSHLYLCIFHFLTHSIFTIKCTLHMYWYYSYSVIVFLIQSLYILSSPSHINNICFKGSIMPPTLCQSPTLV